MFNSQFSIEHRSDLQGEASALTISCQERGINRTCVDWRVPAPTVTVALRGDRIVLTYEHFAGTLVLLFDPETLEMVGRIDISATP